jgi:hypothetical protein
MRRTAVILALVVVVLDLAIYASGEARLVSLTGSVFELGIGAWAARLTVTLAVVLPWVVGAALLWRRRRGLGAAVLVTSALVVFPGVLFVAQWGVDAAGEGGGTGPWIEVAAGALGWLLAIGAGAAAWLARPQAGMRAGSPGKGNGYVLLAFLAWLPTILASTQVVPPGAAGTAEGARHFYEFIWTATSGLGVMVGLLEALVFGTLLLVGPTLRRDAAGAVLLVLVVPALVTEVQTIVLVAREAFVIATPASFLGVVGLAGVAVIGTRWVAGGEPAESEAARRRAAAPEGVDQ